VDPMARRDQRSATAVKWEKNLANQVAVGTFLLLTQFAANARAAPRHESYP
jgi:hypothetical protein